MMANCRDSVGKICACVWRFRTRICSRLQSLTALLLSFARWIGDMNHRTAASWTRNSVIAPAQCWPRFGRITAILPDQTQLVTRSLSIETSVERFRRLFSTTICCFSNVQRWAISLFNTILMVVHLVYHWLFQVNDLAVFVDVVSNQHLISDGSSVYRGLIGEVGTIPTVSKRVTGFSTFINNTLRSSVQEVANVPTIQK